MKPQRHVTAVLHDPGIEIGPYRILPRADNKWIAYDERQPFGRRTAHLGASELEVTQWARNAMLPRQPSWCPTCERPLIGGEHFEGRLCGTCHGATVAVALPEKVA